jgi:alkylhydroperoxidase/carboxymuconolactone decarboxylase family protein YurZ
MLGLASGKEPNCFDRVWFKETVEPADITFDYDTYLLTAAKAKALKLGTPPPPTVPPVPPPTQPPLPPGTRPVTPPVPPVAPKPAVVVWEGELKREQWNLFSLKVLTRLAQSDDLQIDVKVKATLKEGRTTEQLNSALKELGIQDGFRKS